MATFLQRMGYHQTCVLPATVLSADPVDETDPSSLQADASGDGICYLRVIDTFRDGTYLGRVAADPGLVRTHGYTVVLSEAQLACALPWDCRIRSRPFPCHMASQSRQSVPAPAVPSPAPEQEGEVLLSS